MKNLIVMVVAGVALFCGSLFGMLAATGRLNHEGTKGIPLVSSLFPAPAEGEGDEHGAEGDDHDTGSDHGGDSHTADTHGGDSHGGDTHGADDHGDDHGDEHGGEHDQPAELVRVTGHSHKLASGEAPPESAGPTISRTVTESEGDGAPPLSSSGKGSFTEEIANDGYAPGRYFSFPQLESGMRPEAINEMLRYARREREQIDAERKALAVQRELIEDMVAEVETRRDEVRKEMQRLLALRDELDELFIEYRQMVRLVPEDNRAAFKDVATKIETFDDEQAAELLLKNWGEDPDRTLNILDAMKKDRSASILASMDVADSSQIINAILERRKVVTDQRLPGGR